MTENAGGFYENGIDPQTGLRWHVTRTAQQTMVKLGGARFVSAEVVREYQDDRTYSGLVREMRELASRLPIRHVDPEGGPLDREMLKYCPTGEYHYRLLVDGEGNVCVFPCVESRDKGLVTMITTLHYRAHSAMATAVLGTPSREVGGGSEVLRRRA